MFHLLGVAVCTVLLATGVIGVAAGTIKAGSGASRSSSATWRVEEAFHDESKDIQRLQDDARQGVLDQAAGLGEAALNAPSLAAPGVSPNPVGLGLSEGMSLGVLAAQSANDAAEGSGGSGSAGSGTGATGSTGDASGAGASGDSNAGSTGGSSAGTGESSSGSGGGEGVPAGEAPATHYIAWYADDIGYNPIWITTVEAYDAPDIASQWPGGGMDPEAPLLKMPLTGAYPTEKEAADAVYGMMSNPRTMSGIYAGMPVADIGGETHNLEHCGGLQWWQ